MCDNFDTIRDFLNFDNINTLYFINIFQRRKDIPGLSKHAKLIKSYYIRSLSDFDKYKDSIIENCKLNQARAYIELNAKDTQKVALYAMKKTAELIYNGDYDVVKNVYNDSCGNSKCIGQKLWMIDIDSKEINTINKVKEQLLSLESEIRLILDTKNGVHIICTPFPLNKWESIDNVDIIKHATTLLYIYT